MIFKSFAAQRRTEHALAEIIEVKHISVARILPSFEVTYRFTIKNETLTATNGYDVDPTGSAVVVVYEPANPKNNALLLPSKEQIGLTLIAMALIVGGGWLVQRNIARNNQHTKNVFPPAPIES
jgi:hypothetical protein